MPRTASGPPVAESSSAACHRAWTASSMASARDRSGPPAELDGGAGVPPTRAVGVEVGLLVAAAGRVVGVDPAHCPAHVVAGEQGHHHEALHGHGQVGAHHLGQLVGLALEAAGPGPRPSRSARAGAGTAAPSPWPGRRLRRWPPRCGGRPGGPSPSRGGRWTIRPWPAGRRPSPRRRRSGWRTIVVPWRISNGGAGRVAAGEAARRTDPEPDAAQQLDEVRPGVVLGAKHGQCSYGARTLPPPRAA